MPLKGHDLNLTKEFPAPRIFNVDDDEYFIVMTNYADGNPLLYDVKQEKFIKNDIITYNKYNLRPIDHTFSIDYDNNLLYLYNSRGESSMKVVDKKLSDDSQLLSTKTSAMLRFLSIYDMVKRDWIYYQTNNIPNTGRDPSSCIVEGEFHIFGGTENGKHYKYDKNSKTFIELFNFETFGIKSITMHHFLYNKKYKCLMIIGGKIWDGFQSIDTKSDNIYLCRNYTINDNKCNWIKLSNIKLPSKNIEFAVTNIDDEYLIFWDNIVYKVYMENIEIDCKYKTSPNNRDICPLSSYDCYVYSIYSKSNQIIYLFDRKQYYMCYMQSIFREKGDFGNVNRDILKSRIEGFGNNNIQIDVDENKENNIDHIQELQENLLTKNSNINRLSNELKNEKNMNNILKQQINKLKKETESDRYNKLYNEMKLCKQENIDLKQKLFKVTKDNLDNKQALIQNLSFLKFELETIIMININDNNEDEKKEKENDDEKKLLLQKLNDIEKLSNKLQHIMNEQHQELKKIENSMISIKNSMNENFQNKITMLINKIQILNSNLRIEAETGKKNKLLTLKALKCSISEIKQVKSKNESNFWWSFEYFSEYLTEKFPIIINTLQFYVIITTFLTGLANEDECSSAEYMFRLFIIITGIIQPTIVAYTQYVYDEIEQNKLCNFIKYYWFRLILLFLSFGIIDQRPFSCFKNNDETVGYIFLIILLIFVSILILWTKCIKKNKADGDDTKKIWISPYIGNRKHDLTNFHCLNNEPLYGIQYDKMNDGNFIMITDVKGRFNAIERDTDDNDDEKKTNYSKINQEEENKYDDYVKGEYIEICTNPKEYITKCTVYYGVYRKSNETQGICALSFDTNFKRTVNIGDIDNEKRLSSDLWINTYVFKPPYSAWPNVYILNGFNIGLSEELALMRGIQCKFVKIDAFGS